MKNGFNYVKDLETEALPEQPDKAVEAAEASNAFRQEVEEITEAVGEVVSETSLADKVEELRTYIDNISEDVQSWRSSRAQTYAEALETLKSQVEEIQTEWNAVSSGMKTHRERLEALLESFPGAIETSAVRALSLRVSHLEKLVADLVDETNTKDSTRRAKKQVTISLVALAVTVALWALWLALSFLN